MNLFLHWAALAISLVLPLFSYGQLKENMLLNGSLELNHSDCPIGGIDSLRYVPNWTGIITPDLVCSCNPTGLWEPTAREIPDGHCYATLGIDFVRFNEVGEIIVGRLNNPLIVNRKYCVEFSYSVSKGARYFSNIIDVLFTKSNLAEDYLSVEEDNFPEGDQSTSVLLQFDTIDWRFSRSVLISRGGERYLAIGFLKNPNRIYENLQNNTLRAAMFYIDSIAVYDCTEGIEFALPNVFTPNGDGENEVYRSDQFNVDRVEWVVLNRWGQVVHSGKAPELEWDGRDVHSGEELAEGVYFVRATAYGNDGSTRTEQQTVHLMR